jgi:hypothetical protein
VRIGKLTHTALLALLLGASGLVAQEGPYSYLMKIRTGLMSGDMQKTHFDNKVIAFGLEAKRDIHDWFGIKGSLFAEVAWEYVPGRHHDIYPWDTNPLKRFDDTPLDIQYSFDNRKEYGQGINLKLGYSAPMPSFGSAAVGNFFNDMEWFAGLGIDRFRVRSEVKYTFKFSSAAGDPAFGQYDGGAFVEEGAQMAPGVFVGLKYKHKEGIGFEVSLRNFGMWHYEYTPPAYIIGDYVSNPDLRGLFGQREFGRESTGTTRGTSIEFAITLKL